jgi:iron complex outermembrane receptor protein
MPINIKRGLLLSTAAIGGLSAFCMSSYAAATANKADEIEEITVVARMRTETLQSVPVAVDAFSAKMIEDAGITRPNDFIALSPNVTLTESQDAGTSFLTIRGVSQVRNGEPSVALIIDGVAQASPSVITQELFDIAHIEVLKGPQGALYGRNSIGGAIVITTKQPTNNFEGWVRVGAGNGGLVKAQASVSGPIIKDKLLFTIAGSTISNDGYLENVYLRKKADPYKDQSFHALLKWNPTEHVAVDLRGGFTHTTGGALNFVVNSNPLFFTLPGGADDTSLPIHAAYLGQQVRNLRDVSLKINIDTGFGTLSSISAYAYDSNLSEGMAAPYDSAGASGGQGGVTTNKNYSQELRFTSPSEERFRYIVGGYYLHTDRNYLITNEAFNSVGIFVPYGINTSGPDQTTYASWNKEKRDAYAVFGQLAFDITDQLEISGAIRYDRDKRKQTNVLPIVPTNLIDPWWAPVASNFTYPVNPNLGQSQSATFDKWQPKVTLTYKPGKDLTIYANYAQGFSSGGFNPIGLAAVAAGYGLNGLSDIYHPETVITYEGGIKARLMDGRLRLGGSVFKTKAKNLNFFSYFYQVNAQMISTMNEDLWGFEAEAELKVVDGLDLFAGYGYTHSKITDYAVDQSVNGNTGPYIPKDSYNLGAQYKAPVIGDTDVLARVEYTVKGTQYWEPYNITSRKPVRLTNVRFGFQNDTSGWSLTAWARNLFDTKYNAEYVGGGFVQQGTPRTYGLDLQKKF